MIDSPCLAWRRRSAAIAAAAFLFAVAGSPLSAQESAPSDIYSLSRSIQVALDNSRTLQDVEMQLQLAGQQVREAWSSVMPDIRANASYSRNLKVQQAFLPAFIFDPNAGPNDLVPVRFGSDNTWRLGLTFDQPLFEAAAFIGVSAAGRFQDLQAERVRGVAQQVVTGVRQAYFDALLAEEDVRLTEKSLERVGKTLDETRALNRAGLASEYDVLRLEVQFANLEPNLQRARNAVAAAKRRLLVEMGLNPEQSIGVEGSLSSIDLAELERNDAANAALLRVAGSADLVQQEFEELLPRALRQRSDIRQLDATITLEQARRAAERAEFFPKLSVFSNYDITAQENGALNFFGAGPNQRSTSTVAGLVVEVPIFTGFSRSARVGQATARVRQNEALRERAEQETASEVRTLLETVQEARARAAAQRRAVDQAQRGFEIASAEYNAGVGSQLQITDAEVALRESEFNYARAVYDYLSARAQLEATVGAVPDKAGTLATQNGSERE
jgi:outer membrane protein TolC